VFEISALTREGCEPLVKAMYKHVKAQQVAEQPVVEIDPRFVESLTSPNLLLKYSCLRICDGARAKMTQISNSRVA
jgi:hypothetical protein